MTDKPTIAILGGTGHEGTGLALRWATNGYDVIIGSRKEEKALKVTAELNEILGEELIRGMENGPAAREADINVLTVVATAHQAAVTGLKDDLQGKILVDATARIQFPNPKPPEPPSAARIAQDILGEDVQAGLEGREEHVAVDHGGLEGGPLVLTHCQVPVGEAKVQLRAGRREIIGHQGRHEHQI